MVELSMQEVIRQAREKAWAEGYAARDQRHPRDRSTWKSNPYRKVTQDGSNEKVPRR